MKGCKGRRILLLGEDTSVSARLADLLAERGHDAMAFHSRGELKAALAAQEPDLIIVCVAAGASGESGLNIGRTPLQYVGHPVRSADHELGRGRCVRGRRGRCARSPRQQLRQPAALCAGDLRGPRTASRASPVAPPHRAAERGTAAGARHQRRNRGAHGADAAQPTTGVRGAARRGACAALPTERVRRRAAAVARVAERPSSILEQSARTLET